MPGRKGNSFGRAQGNVHKKQPYEEYSFDHSTFSCCTLAAQEYIPTYGREPMRGELLVYPTAREAAEADGSDNKYFTRLTEWTQKGNSFTTDFTVPFAWANRQVLLRIGWASADYEIRINGGTVAYNSDCNAPAEFNLTRHAKEGRNTLEVILSSPSKVARLESWKMMPHRPSERHGS